MFQNATYRAVKNRRKKQQFSLAEHKECIALYAHLFRYLIGWNSHVFQCRQFSRKSLEGIENSWENHRKSAENSDIKCEKIVSWVKTFKIREYFLVNSTSQKTQPKSKQIWKITTKQQMNSIKLITQAIRSYVTTAAHSKSAPHLVKLQAVACGFPKDLQQGKYKAGKYGEDSWFRTSNEKADVLGKSGLNSNSYQTVSLNLNRFLQCYKVQTESTRNGN